MATPRKKTAEPAPPTVAQDIDAALLAQATAAEVDELGWREQIVAPHTARIEALRKAIRERANAKPADAACELRGDKYVAVLGPCANATKIDFAGLVKIIKASAFAKFATCTLAALSKNVTAGVYETVTSVDKNTGPRSVKTFALAPAEKVVVGHELKLMPLQQREAQQREGGF